MAGRSGRATAFAPALKVGGKVPTRLRRGRQLMFVDVPMDGRDLLMEAATVRRMIKRRWPLIETYDAG